jgi:hypothetical protein
MHAKIKLVAKLVVKPFDGMMVKLHSSSLQAKLRKFWAQWIRSLASPGVIRLMEGQTSVFQAKVVIKSHKYLISVKIKTPFYFINSGSVGRFKMLNNILKKYSFMCAQV